MTGKYLNKKAASILIIGLVFFFVMGVLTIIVWQTVDKMRFDKFAGESAQEISELKYISYKQQFFVESLLSSFMQNTFLPKDYYGYLISNEAIPHDGSIIILERANAQYYDKLEHYIALYLEELFNDFYMVESANYNDIIQNEMFRKDPNHFYLKTTNYYFLHIQGSDIRALSSEKSYSQKSSNRYYHLPSATVERTNIQEVLSEFLLPKRFIEEFQSCLIAQRTNSDVLLECTSHTQDALGVDVVSANSIGNEIILNVQIHDTLFSYQFDSVI